jgi:hypothetical protein
LELALSVRGNPFRIQTITDKEHKNFIFSPEEDMYFHFAELPLTGSGRTVQLQITSDGSYFEIEDGFELLLDMQKRPV